MSLRGNFYPQRAEGTHHAEGASLLPAGKNIASSLFKVSLPGDCHATLAMTKKYGLNK